MAHTGLRGVVVPTLVAPDTVWAYDLAFLVVALVPMAIIANCLRRNLEAASDHVTEALADDLSVEAGEPTDAG